MHPPVDPPSATGLRWFGLTDRGKVRKNNEDAFLALCFDAQEVRYLGKIGESSLGHTDFAFAVSDGIGGAQAGEFASRITVEKITSLLPKSYKQSAAGIEAGVADVLTELFDQIHRALVYLAAGYEECSGMGATLSICWFSPRWMHFGHIGDSRIYYFPASGSMQQISHDDTHVGWLLRNSKISEHEARVHPRRNMLQRALGAGNQFVEPQVGSVAYGRGDLFLLCTDGVVDGLFDNQLLEVLRPALGEEAGANPAQRLVEAALERAGRDNTTAVVIEVV
jgi:PPM family protein phosphatase